MDAIPIPALIAVATVLFAPVFLVHLFGGRVAQGDAALLFATNAGHNGLAATFAGAVAGNVGIGSFLALFLFSQGSPVIGFSIVGAYTLGLVLCALLARPIRTAAARAGTVGLIDLIARSHAIERTSLVWLPVAVVFVLRSAVQLGALAALGGSLFAMDGTVAIALSAALIGSYLLLGGYRAAVQTDMVQAVFIVGGGLACLTGLGRLTGEPVPFLSFGAYEPAILAGVWLFIPWSAVLAVDNWQRVTVAQSTGVAQAAYLGAAGVCGALFLLMALAGHGAPAGATMYDTFLSLVPPGLGWLVWAMFVACIMSSIDTFLMPLVAATGGRSIAGMRALVVLLVSATALAAIAFADTLDTVIAAFNSLAVFLPTAFGALFLANPPRFAAVASMNGGLAAAIGFTLVDQNSAALVGFVVACLLYGVGIWRAGGLGREGERAG